MEFSKYASKYKRFNFGKWSVPEIEPINIDKLKESTAEPVNIEQVVEEEVPEVIPGKKTVKRTTTKYPVTSKGLAEFNKYYDSLLNGPDAEQLRQRRRVFTHLALVESGFDSSTQNKAGAPAFGYFQFMLGNYNGKDYDNIGRYAGVDIGTFRNNPTLLILAANKLANEFMSSFSNSELNTLHKLGWTDNAILAGCWLGGPGGVRKLAFRGIDSSDGSTSVSKRMKQFNY